MVLTVEAHGHLQWRADIAAGYDRTHGHSVRSYVHTSKCENENVRYATKIRNLGMHVLDRTYPYANWRVETAKSNPLNFTEKLKIRTRNFLFAQIFSQNVFFQLLRLLL